MWRRYLIVVLHETVWCTCQIYHQGDMQPDCRHELMVRPHLDNSHWVSNHWSFGAVESILQSLEWCFAEGGGCYGTCYLVEYLVMYALEILFGILDIFI